MKDGTFGGDLEFLKKYTDVFVLSDKSGKSQVDQVHNQDIRRIML